MDRYRQTVIEKGGRILENRTSHKGINVGDKFALQSLRGPYTVEFFFKDAIFDHGLMVLGICKHTGEFLMCATGLLEVLEKNEKLIIKRRRRI